MVEEHYQASGLWPYDPARARLLSAALLCFAAQGFEGTTVRQIASEAGVSLEQALLIYPSQHALAHALYDVLAADALAHVADLPEGTLGVRFASLMNAILDGLDKHRSSTLALVAAAMDTKDPPQFLSGAGSWVRARLVGAFLTVVAGSTDARGSAARLATMLHGVQLAITYLWTQDENGRMARSAVAHIQDLCYLASSRASPSIAERLGSITAVFGDRLETVVTADVERRSRWILWRLMDQRHLPSTAPQRGEPLDRRSRRVMVTEEELAPHLPLVRAALSAERPLEFLLPSFPAKSRSPRMVLGKLPDMAEHIALQALQCLCEEIAEVHPPGVRLMICSDGLVAADVLGLTDEDVIAYGAGIDERLAELPLLARFDLTDAFGALSPSDARERLITAWAGPEADLLRLTIASPAVGAQLEGMHRVLLEEAVAISANGSLPDVRSRAVELLRRSRAWDRLLLALFPMALRLSVQPQFAVSDKIGVQLLPGEDAWLAPWQGVALFERDQVRLVKRAEAETLGAARVDVEGTPSHFTLP